MAAPRPKKKPPVKKAPVKKAPAKKPDVKSPAETRKSISRKQVGTSRPARGDLGARAQYLKYGPTQPQGPEAPRYQQKIGPVKPTASAGSKALALLGKVAKVSGIVGAITSPITSAVPAGTGSTVPGQAQKAVEKKMKREIRQGPALAVTGVKEGIIGRTRSLRNKTGQNRPEYPTWKNKPKASVSPTTGAGRPEYPASNKGKKSSAGSPFPKGKGTASLPKGKSSSSSTAATTAAASGSSSTSKAAKSGVGRQTRYQRNETAMEQKRSSGKPKKSIFSLFRKG